MKVIHSISHWRDIYKELNMKQESDYSKDRFWFIHTYLNKTAKIKVIDGIRLHKADAKAGEVISSPA